MKRTRALSFAAVLGIVVVSLSGCLALTPEPPPVVGALGVTVDEEGRPVLVVEPCGGTAARVDLSWTREGLAAEQENEELGSFVAPAAEAGWTELVLHDPAPPWEGEPVEVEPGPRGVIATGTTTDSDILTQVTFRRRELSGMAPGTVYLNDPSSEEGALQAMSRAEFSSLVCGRG